MKTVILSAFGPFGAYPANSSELVVQRLVQYGVHGFEAAGVTFACKIPQEDRGKTLVRWALHTGASAILSLGMASEKKGLCIEKRAMNVVNNEKYCPLELQGTRVHEADAYGHRLTLDLTPWNIGAFDKACRAEGLPVHYSADAGGFCCNHLAYQTRRYLREIGSSIPYTFVHLPCCPEAISDPKEFAEAGKISMSVDRMARGIELLLRHAAL